jgi:hypothetical protein
MKRILILLSLVGAAIGLTGCSTTQLVRVQPWERATLAEYTMNPARDPLETSMIEHVFTSRETASGGTGVGGAGCGCN